MQDSVFTKIINGEIPCHKVFEDDSSFAFMDIHPIQPGQVVVVSKRQVENFYELTDDEYQALFAAVKQVALRLRQHFPDAKRIAVIIEGLEVAHVHVKVFPISTGQQLRAQPDVNEEPDHTKLAKLAAALHY